MVRIHIQGMAATLSASRGAALFSQTDGLVVQSFFKSHLVLQLQPGPTAEPQVNKLGFNFCRMELRE